MSSGDPAPILPLSAQTASLLRATQQLPSLPSTLSFLLLHLLDLVGPTSSQLSVTLDPARWGVRIHIDGDGLAIDEYDRVASGQGVGLVGRLAVLELEGRDRAGVQRTCIIKSGNVLHNGPSSVASRAAGTTLTIKDLFFNVPIRRLSAPSASTLQSRCLRLVEQLSLARFGLAFRVWDAGKEDAILRVRKAASAQERFAQLHGSALLKTPSPIATSAPPLSLTGFISLSATHSRSTEYFSINGRPLAHGGTAPTSQLHALVEGAFAASRFSERAQAETEPGLSEASPAKVGRGAINERSPRKAVRRPVFALDLRVPPGEVVWEGGEGDSVEFEDWPKVKLFVDGVIRGFLEQHDFLYVAPPATASPEKRRLVFGSPSTSAGALTPGKKRKVDGSPLKASSVNAPSIRAGADPDIVSYRDPTTKQAFKIDRNTGTSQALGQQQNEAASTRDATGGPPSWLKKVLDSWKNPTFPSASEPAIPSTSAVRPSQPSEPTLPFHAVSSLSSTSQGLSGADLHASLGSAQAISQVDHKFIACLLCLPRQAAPFDRVTGQAQRQLLFLLDQHAADERIRVEHFLRELGSGFLANCRQGDAFAHVETRLEGIPLIEPQSEAAILLTAVEHQSLVASPAAQLALARWGITFDLSPPVSPCASTTTIKPTDEHDVQARVVTLPSVVADRLLGRKHLKEGPGELTELVKNYLARLEEAGGAEVLCQAASAAASDDSADWLGAMRFCPSEILDLVDSKACRGAIMFNDRLSLGQCQDLIQRLSRTRLPLQCAHGRPSMVLVADLDAVQQRSQRKGLTRRTVNWEALATDA